MDIFNEKCRLKRIVFKRHFNFILKQDPSVYY